MTLQQIYTRRQKAHEELLACDIAVDGNGDWGEFLPEKGDYKEESITTFGNSETTNKRCEKMKPSEIFEGENSSLRKTFDEAVGVCKLCQHEGGEHSLDCVKYKDICDKHGHPDCMKCFYTTSAELPKK